MTPAFPQLKKLPDTMPQDGAISMTIQNGVPIFRASQAVMNRILELLEKQKEGTISQKEKADLDQFELIDDYLSHLNRLVRNHSQQ